MSPQSFRQNLMPTPRVIDDLSLDKIDNYIIARLGLTIGMSIIIKERN
jgi:hypothetical protein